MELFFGETILEKDSKIIVPKKKGTLFFFGIILWWSTFENGFQNYSSGKKRNYIFFLELFFGETLLKKDSKTIVPKKRNYFFLELYFGETLLKKDSKIIVPKKKELFFFGIIFW